MQVLFYILIALKVYKRNFNPFMLVRIVRYFWETLTNYTHYTNYTSTTPSIVKP